MIQVDNRQILKIYGVTFNGIHEIKKIAWGSGYYKGIYVEVDKQFYLRFDSSDYESESRCIVTSCLAKARIRFKAKWRNFGETSPADVLIKNFDYVRRNNWWRCG